MRRRIGFSGTPPASYRKVITVPAQCTVNRQLLEHVSTKWIIDLAALFGLWLIHRHNRILPFLRPDRPPVALPLDSPDRRRLTLTLGCNPSSKPSP
jgi:hypothetical protein